MPHRAHDDLQRREAILEAVGFAAERFLRAAEPEGQVGEVLGRLGRAAAACRLYVFENRHGEGGDLRIRQRWEWSGEAVASQIDNPELEDIGYAEAGFERWRAILERGEAIHGPIAGFPPAEREFLARQQIVSVAVVPVFVGDAWWGFIGFDDCIGRGTWTSAEVEALRAAGSILGSAILRGRSEAALRDKEEQLRHAQKLEAVGRLAAGVAHDFNNLLTAITGYSQLLLDSLPAAGKQHDWVTQVNGAAERAAGLTRQLLAFGRKQVMRPRVVDLGEVVGGMEKLLRRILGEDVRLETRLDAGTGPVLADPGQLEQVLMNLAVNARDAMPSGGRLVVTTRRAPGTGPATDGGPDHSVLAVEDSGTGIDEATRARMFEPFFTTKEPGRGTGLGLSTVYGIVKQSGGEIVVHSAPGHGSRFEVWLPVTAERPQASQPAEPSETRPGTGTILLAEDDAAVRRLAAQVLDGAGYTVLQASDGDDAQRVATGHAGPIDLVLSDVIMPGCNGPELYRRLQAVRPGLAVLFMSGHAEQALPAPVLRAGFPLIEKPFTPRGLLVAVQDRLARSLTGFTR